MILFGIGILALVYRVALIALRGIRHTLLRRRTDPRYINALEYCLTNASYADWFVLKKLNTNINTIRFGELLEGIKAELVKRSPSGRLSPSSPLPAYTDSDKSFNKDYDDENGDLHTEFINKNV